MPNDGSWRVFQPGALHLSVSGPAFYFLTDSKEAFPEGATHAMWFGSDMEQPWLNGTRFGATKLDSHVSYVWSTKVIPTGVFFDLNLALFGIGQNSES